MVHRVVTNSTLSNDAIRLNDDLTHWDQVTSLVQIMACQLAGADQATSHFLNQCWNIVNLNLRNKLHWNVNEGSYIFIQENACENVVCEMAAILSQPQCVKQSGKPLEIHPDKMTVTISPSKSFSLMTYNQKFHFQSGIHFTLAWISYLTDQSAKKRLFLVICQRSWSR